MDKELRNKAKWQFKNARVNLADAVADLSGNMSEKELKLYQNIRQELDDMFSLLGDKEPYRTNAQKYQEQEKIGE